MGKTFRRIAVASIVFSLLMLGTLAAMPSRDVPLEWDGVPVAGLSSIPATTVADR